MGRRLLIVSGPTASGKSEIALRLAEQVGGEIVNVDSVQVYRGLDTASAKPNRSERSRVPHHLVDIRDPDDQYHVSAFVADADEAIADIRSRGRLPILTGGTTLYITALLHGLAELPSGDPEFRALCDRRPSEDLYAELARSDPATASRLHPNDRLRVTRALETLHVTGEPASLIHSRHAHRTVRHSAIVIVPVWPRPELYERINRRAASFLAAGLVEETRGLIERHGSSNLAGLKSLGYAQTVEMLEGRIAPEALIDEIAKATRHFAKRQMTYWRNEPAKRGWVVRPAEGEGRFVEDPRSGEKPLRVITATFEDLASELSSATADLGSMVEIRLLDARVLVG